MGDGLITLLLKRVFLSSGLWLDDMMIKNSWEVKNGVVHILDSWYIFLYYSLLYFSLILPCKRLVYFYFWAGLWRNHPIIPSLTLQDHFRVYKSFWMFFYILIFIINSIVFQISKLTTSRYNMRSSSFWLWKLPFVALL